MSIAYHLDKERGSTLACWGGTVTLAEFMAHIHRLIADPGWPAGQLYLTDLRGVHLHPSIDEATLEMAADLFGQYRNKIASLRMAIVADEAFPQSRIFERHLSKYGPIVIVFADFATACTWLGLQVDVAERTLAQLRTQSIMPRPESDSR